MFLVIGLGNPGAAYARTRHNIGYMVADLLCRRLGGAFRTRADHDYAAVEKDGRPVFLCKPTTYMNRSGRAVLSALAAMNEPPEAMLIVCDDMALPLGRLRLRLQGSSGGHNGLESIFDSLGSRDVPRLRCGVDAPPEGRPAADYVLEEFTADETAAAEALVERAADAVLCAVDAGFEKTMQLYNTTPTQTEDSL